MIYSRTRHRLLVALGLTLVGLPLPLTASSSLRGHDTGPDKTSATAMDRRLSASPRASGTEVFLTNRTKRTLKLSYSGGPLPAGEHYRRGAGSIKPGQRLRILRVSRDPGIKNGRTYHFYTSIDLGPKSQVVLGQRLKGNFVGSTIWMGVGKAGAAMKWHPKKNVTQRVADKWQVGGQTYAVDARWRWEFGWVYDNIEYTITETGRITPANELNLWQHNIQQRPSSEGLQHQAGLGHSERSRLSTIYLPSAIRRFDPNIDVVTVNEAFTASLRPELKVNMKKHGFLYSTNVLAKSGSAAWSGGVMVFSKHKIIRTKEHVFKHYAGADRNADKGVLYVEIRKGNRPYHIFATHLNASYTFGGKTRLPLGDDGRKARRKQFREIRAFIDNQRIPSTQPVIIVGDMNVDMHSEKGRPQDEYADMLSALNAVHPPQSGHPFSLDKNTNEFADPEDGPPQYLDYVLFSKGHLRPVASSNAVICLKSDGANRARKGSGRSRDLSDHYPLQAKFTFPVRIPQPVSLAAGRWLDSNGAQIDIAVSGGQVIATMRTPSARRWWTTGTGKVAGSTIPAMTHKRGSTTVDTQRGAISQGGRHIKWTNGSSWKFVSPKPWQR